MTEQQMSLRFIKADHTMETILDWEKYINFLTNLHPHLLDDFFWMILQKQLENNY